MNPATPRYLTKSRFKLPRRGWDGASEEQITERFAHLQLASQPNQ